jgi:hypothetical protein
VWARAQNPDVWREGIASNWPALYWPAGHGMTQRTAGAAGTVPAGHAAQLTPRPAANRPAGHGLHAAAPALVLPRAPPSPGGHGVPLQALRAPLAAACVPLAHRVQPWHRHLMREAQSEGSLLAAFPLKKSCSGTVSPTTVTPLA